jgi:hypothetical protein
MTAEGQLPGNGRTGLRSAAGALSDFPTFFVPVFHPSARPQSFSPFFLHVSLLEFISYLYESV